MKPQCMLRLLPLLLLTAFGTSNAEIISLGDVNPDVNAPGACSATSNCTITGPLMVGTGVTGGVATGTVEVNAGSILSSSVGGQVGSNGGNGSSGMLTVTGAGSRFEIPAGGGNFTVGFGPGDVGTVVVENNGLFKTNSSTAPSNIAGQEGSTGTVTVKTGGMLEFGGPYIVLGGGLAGGRPGATTSATLVIEQGGIAKVTGSIGGGNFSGSQGLLRVSDSGSVLTVDAAGSGSSSALAFGLSNGLGSNTVLVEKGGALQTVNGSLTLGAATGYQQNVTVRDNGSKFDLSSGVIAASGQGGEIKVLVSDKGALSAGAVMLQGSAANPASTATTRLDVESGGAIAVTGVTSGAVLGIGGGSGSAYASTMRVAGPGSTATVASGMVNVGAGGSLVVEPGAKVTLGGDVLPPVQPPANEFGYPTASSLLGIGQSGPATTQLQVSAGTVSGSFAAVGNADIWVSNGGRIVMSDALHTGYTLLSNPSATRFVNVDSGGTISAPSLIIGGPSNSPVIATVSGTGSRLDAPIPSGTSSIWPGLYVGAGVNTKGTLTLQNGGQSEARNIGLGASQGSEGTINVRTGGQIKSLGSIGVGGQGTGSLNVSGGGLATAQNATVGQGIGGSGNITVSGTGSELRLVTTSANPTDPIANLVVGREGAGTLNVSSGGRVLIDAVSQGTNRFGGLNAGGAGGTPPPGATGDGTINVSGAGSEIRFVQNAGADTQYYGTTIGRQGKGTLNVTGGGRVITENLDAAFSVVGRTATGVGEALVSGANSLWEAGKRLFIATDVNVVAGSQELATPIGNGGTGKVTVANGGVVKVSDYVYVAAGGTLAGNGTVVGKVINAGGSVAPGLSPGTLNIQGGFSMSGGLLEIQVAGLGAGQFDVLHVSGAADLSGGTIMFSFIDGFVPDAGDWFDFLVADGGLTLDSDVLFDFEGLDPGFQFDVETIDGTLRFVAVGDGTTVPAPGTASLFVAALVLLASSRRQGL